MTEMLRLPSKYFGEIEYESKDVIHFASGLFGFEEEQEFLLMPFDGSGGGMLCLQSVKTPALAFVAVNPFSYKPDYAPELAPQELARLEAADSRELCYYALCVVREPVADSTVNLRCPIVVNDRTRQAVQTILDTPEYGMRHPLSELHSQKEEAPC